MDGVEHRFELAGLWGGGSTVTERDLNVSGENTIYSMWDGLGIVGPRTGERLEHFPGLWGRVTLKTFRERYGSLDDCTLMTGEQLGPECPAYCAQIDAKCPDGPLAGRCEEACANLPRSTLDCLADREGICDPQECLWVERLPSGAGSTEGA